MIRNLFSRFIKLLALSMLYHFSSFAQNASQYGFTALSGTFAEITGGTAFTAVQFDDVLPTTLIPIGFSFEFCGTTYTNIRAGSNGFMSFSTGASNTSVNATTSFNTIKPALLWLWDDLDGVTGTAHYITTGTAPNRVFTFQYKNWEWNWSTTGPNITVQVKLYETTNIIEYHYRPEAQPGNPSGSGGASIGIVDNLGTATYLSLNNATTTPTASSTVFTTSIATKPASGQIYRFTPPAPCNASTVYPNSASTSIMNNKDTICIGNSSTLSMTPASAMPIVTGLTYQVQYSAIATGPWTNVGTPSSSYVNIPFTPANSGYYRILTLCTGSPTTFASDSKYVHVSNPSPVTASNITRCGPGNVVLNAAGGGSNTIFWYNSLTSLTPFATGNNISTYVPSTTTYYVASGIPPYFDTLNVGVGANASSTSSTTPFLGGWGGYKHEYLITQADLASWGITPGTTIYSLGIQIRSGGATYNGFQISMGTTSAANLTTTYVTGTTVVRNPVNQTVSIGVNYFDLTTPYTYTGGNLVIQTCWSNNNSSNTYSYVVDDNTTYTSTHYYYRDNVTPASMCGNTSGGSTLSIRPKFLFRVLSTCESSRTPMTVTITPTPDLTVAYDSVICNNATMQLNVTSNVNNFNNYSWEYVGAAPNTLFNDANATTPYSNTSRTNIFFKSNLPGSQRVVLNATNSVSGCANSDTFNVFVNPGPDQLNITGEEDTLCLTGISSINVDQPNYLKSGFFSWFQSDSASNYTALTNPTLPFNTPTLTNHKYYRVITRSVSGNCDTFNKTIYVANPNVVTTINDTICGAGTATLIAHGNLGEEIQWFNSPTGGTPLGSGDTFTTPYISNTTTFYALSSVGSSLDTVQNNTGTLSSGGTSAGPFNIWYRRTTMQIMYTPAEIIAAGGQAGMIKSLAFNCTGPTTYPFANYTVRIATAPASMTTLTWQNLTNFTQVHNKPTYQPTMGWNYFDFDMPFQWNGVDNIIVYLCWDYTPGGISSTNGTHEYTSLSGRMLYTWTDGSGSSCGETGSTTSTLVPNARFVIESGCKSNVVPVEAVVSERPDVDLGPDIDKCVNEGHLEFLNARNPGLNYTWDNGYNGQVRVIDTSGTYWVEVENAGCRTADTLVVNFKYNPKSMLGNDTTTCVGATITLDAGNYGTQYMWNTGQTSSSIDVDRSGVYEVVITGDNGCVVIDSIKVTQIGAYPSYNGIRVRNINSNTFQFNLNNSSNISSVSWDFGDGSPISYSLAPMHAYQQSGNFIVRVIANSNCGFVSDTTTIHIKGYTDIADLENNDAIKVYPNPAQHYFVLSMENGTKIKQVNVLTAAGRLVKVVGNINQSEVNIETDDLSTGFYYLTIETKDGVYKRKLDIIK